MIRIIRTQYNLIPNLSKVIFNDPVTVIIWEDGSKTLVRCSDDEAYDEHAGLAMCIAKKFFGSKNQFDKTVENWSSKKKSKKNMENILIEGFENNNYVFEAPPVMPDGSILPKKIDSNDAVIGFYKDRNYIVWLPDWNRWSISISGEEIPSWLFYYEYVLAKEAGTSKVQWYRNKVSK